MNEAEVLANAIATNKNSYEVLDDTFKETVLNYLRKDYPVLNLMTSFYHEERYLELFFTLHGVDLNITLHFNTEEVKNISMDLDVEFESMEQSKQYFILLGELSSQVRNKSSYLIKKVVTLFKAKDSLFDTHEELQTQLANL